MRTQDEIVARLKQIAKDDLFGFGADVLLPYLDKEHVTPFLKPGAEMTWEIASQAEPDILAEASQYMVFAWGKVEDHRGLSAGRSVQKLTEWCWLLGKDDLVKKIEAASYAPYGAPKLKVICEALGLPMPDSPDVVRMMNGEPCSDYCQGCGA